MVDDVDTIWLIYLVGGLVGVSALLVEFWANRVVFKRSLEELETDHDNSQPR